MRLQIILEWLLMLIIIANGLIINAKLCKITYSRTAKFNISRSKMLNVYNNYSLINETSTRSICYIFNNNKEIDVCFKGTSNIMDIYYNFNVCQNSYINNKIKVHNGFLSKYLSIKEKIIEKINEILKINDIKTITFNGHSSGGAMATIASLDIRNKINRSDMIINCITFGCPRVGNLEFIKEYNRNINKSLRVVMMEDIIQYVPFTTDYYHVHNETLLKGKTAFNISKFIEDIYGYFKIQHGITNYIKSLINFN